MGMPFSLKYASDERHELQSMAVGMIEQALTAKKDALAATAAETENNLNGLKASESQLGTNVTDSEAALAAQKEVVEAKKNALADAKAADTASAANLSEKKSEQKAGDKKFVEMQKDEVAIKAAFEEHFPPMKEGESTAHYKKLQPFLTKLNLEATLLTALPSCCSKTVAERGSFDNIALEEFEKTFKEKIAALSAAVANEGPAAEARQSATEAAEKDREAKKAALDGAKAESDAAGKELKEHEAALKAARKAVEEFQPKVVDMTGQLEKEQQAASDFAAGPYADFTTLKSRVAHPPEEPAAEAPAEAVPEEAAAEPAPAEAAA